MRAELGAIYTALDKFAAHEWVGIFTDSLSSLQAIRHCYTNPGADGSHHYHFHMLLLSGIADLLEERHIRGFSTTLHKIRTHTNIRGNDLADATAEMAVTQYDYLPESQKLRVTVGESAPRPPYWGMYTVKPPPPLLIWGRTLGRLRYANHDGQFQKGVDSRCTPSRAHLHISDINSDTRSYVAFTLPPYTSASYFKT
jgi:ribonuclease HI